MTLSLWILKKHIILPFFYLQSIMIVPWIEACGWSWDTISQWRLGIRIPDLLMTRSHPLEHGFTFHKFPLNSPQNVSYAPRGPCWESNQGGWHNDHYRVGEVCTCVCGDWPPEAVSSIGIRYGGISNSLNMKDSVTFALVVDTIIIMMMSPQKLTPTKKT